jgi:Cyclin
VSPELIRAYLDRRLLVVCLCNKLMTARNGHASGSTESSLPVEYQNPSHRMSAASVYPPPYHPGSSTFNHNPPTPPRVFRRPSQPGAPAYSNQCVPAPTASAFTVSDQDAASSDGFPRGGIGNEPPSTSAQGPAPTMTQPITHRANSNIPLVRSPSHPHPRISTRLGPGSPIEPAVHLDIVYHPVADIVGMLALKLQNLITTNDRLKHSSNASSPTTRYATSTSSKSDSRLLSFHARNIPSITITAYLNRILKYCPTDPEVFISVLVYFDRIMRIANSHAEPIFGVYFSPYSNPIHPLVRSPVASSPGEDDSFSIDSFNVHRLVITTVAVATKFFSDQFYTNSRYARVIFYSYMRLTIGGRFATS